MNYREAILGDLDSLLAVEQKVVEAERPFNSSIKAGKTHYYDIAKLIVENDSYVVVAEDDDRIIGTGYAQIRPSKESLRHDSHSYLGFMYVSPEYRGRGVNRRIVDLLITWSRAQGVRDCYLDVYSENSSAIRAYEKIGFQPSMVEMKLSI